MIVAFFWARSLGGESVQERFIGITQQGAMRTYQENRGGFVSETFGDLLDKYPFGAGLGRWGMMQIYFANPDKVESAPIYVEIQLTGWLLDGGVPMWVLYGGAVLMSLLASYRTLRAQATTRTGQPGPYRLLRPGADCGVRLGRPRLQHPTRHSLLVPGQLPVRRGTRRDARDRRPQSMTRTRRFIGGVTLGSLQLVLATVVGLWMTPFLLGRLGSETLGLWLIAQQLLGYLMLMDLGVNAVLPRETAYAMGRAGGVSAELPQVIARARRAVNFQIPLVVAATLAAGLWVATRGVGAAMPLLLVLAGFALLFPLRLYQSVLQGLQELPFLGKLQIVSWATLTVVTIALVLAGAGLWALVIGWVTGQIITAAAAWLRVSAAPSRRLAGN